MSASSEYEPVAQEDYGPTTSSENVTKQILTDNMSLSSVKTPILRAKTLSPVPDDTEPDSTNPESINSASNKLEQEVEYHISEKITENDMSVDTLSGIVRIEEATIDNMGRLTYPIIQETDDLSDGNYLENTATLIQAPLNTAIVQNVTKLPQNFTINVDGTVGNITSIQNVSQDVANNQTLWLPTIITSSAVPTDLKDEDDKSSTGVSQILITSENYGNDVNQTRRTNIVTDTSFLNRSKASKVQILSNISLPKTPFAPQYVTTGKDIMSQVYGSTHNHVYKMSTNVISQKHLINSVLCSKPSKNQSLIGYPILPAGVINSSPIKSVAYSHTITKNSGLNKAMNKVNNGANLNAMVAASSGNTQCHILSRVVSGPNKMSVHSGRKSVNTFKGPKNSLQTSGNPKNQSRAIKIIQQTGSVHKSEAKTWPVASVATYKPTPPIYGVIDASASKIIQKVGSPTHKSQQQPMTLQKVPKGERLVLQSPCGPVLISTAPISASLTRAPHYVQSGATPNLRYVQTYGTSDHQLPNMSQVSANQQLTAQILQSLSQPKLMLQTNSLPINHIAPEIEEPVELKPDNKRRIVFGDKTTLLTADDIIGMEERPNLYEELQRYTVQGQVFVMLDHTYALPIQKQPSPPVPAAPPAPPALPAPPAASSPAPPALPATLALPELAPAPAPAPISVPVLPPASPVKRTSPVIVSTATYEMPPSTPTSAAPPSSHGIQTMQLPNLPYNSVAPPDDDAGSVISSLDGDRNQPRGGSDTETAPEGEEEGKTRCICDFTHDDGYMICCDRCGEWQHVDCMGIDRLNIPDAYMCELCFPRPVDRRHARAIQLRKREELYALAGSDSDSSELGRLPGQRRKRLLTVTTYTNTTGSSVTTYNAGVLVLPPAPQPPQPPPPPPMPKRGPKRPKKTEIMRKGVKRKFAEKRVKRKKEMMMNRKYSSSMSSQSHWQESYELAVTNHYSPELRAKMIKYSSKLGNTGNMAVAVTAHLCTTVPHAGGKILIATKDLKENMPIIEMRGKYMLSTQHRPQPLPSSRLHSQKPGPFVFFYRLPKDNTQICIDTRTYGNEARFVRRSCKPNAELQHCIVKSALHVYLVTTTDIQSNTEITVGHDSNSSKQPCACGNPKHCKLNGVNTMGPRKSIDGPPREKRNKTRTYSSSSPMSPPMTSTPSTPIKEQLPPILTPIKSEKKSPIKHEYPPISPVKSSSVATALTFEEPIKAEIEPSLCDIKTEIDLFAKEEMKPEDIDEPDFVKAEAEPVIEPEVKKTKMEESKAEQIEKVEPIIEPKLEEPVVKPKDESEALESDEDKNDKPIEKIVPKEEAKKEIDKTEMREVKAKSACHDRSSRSSRTACTNNDSLDDKTDDSQDRLPNNTREKDKDKKKMTREERKMEAIMKAFERMEKAQQRKQEVKERQKRRESEPHPSATDKDDDDSNCHIKKRRRRRGRARTTSQSQRRRLNSADSDLPTSADEAPRSPRSPPRTPRTPDDIGLSSACLLVEAAVGSVESAFKLPKTKKTIASSWLERSPERSPSPCRSRYGGGLMGAASLDSLVLVASTMIGSLCAREPSPPRRRPRPAAAPQHSAKKRWLRQAISEESDAPAQLESPPSEMVTPLKKRRLARESLSYEQNAVVPCNEDASPVQTSENSPVKCDDRARIDESRQNKLRSIMENMYGARDRTRSDSGQGSDDQCNIDHDVLNVNIDQAQHSEHIRRIIGVPTPEDEQPPENVKPEYIRTNNNNVELEGCNYNKAVPMDIDTTITPQQKIQDSNDDVNCLDSPDKPQSADTSGNSSPQRDEMDDIQKKIHSFHTENILMLKSRNRKPPKEKRKKVNLNFDLNMVDDQISVELRTEDSPVVNGDEEVVLDDKVHVSPENIPLPPVESIPLPAPETIPLPAEPNPTVTPLLPPPESIPLPDEPIPLPDEPMKPAPQLLDNDLPFSTRFSSTGLFSGIFSNINQTFNMESSINENVPNLSIIKSAIDSSSLFDKDDDSPVDELKSVQKILTRVNNMDLNNSVLLSGVLKNSNKVCGSLSPRPAKLYCPRSNDPRLNPPPADKPKPVRRKLSISEYRRRHKCGGAEEEAGAGGEAGAEAGAGAGVDEPLVEWSSSSSGAGSLSPHRLDAAAAAAVDDLEHRLHSDLATPLLPKGVFDAAPTASERQREKLSSRLRREFGLALPEDSNLCPSDPTAANNKRCDR